MHIPLSFILFKIFYGALLLSCFLAGCLFVRKNWLLEYKLLVILSGLTLLVESTAMLLVAHRIYHFWLYNLFAPVECGFILYILYRGSIHPAIKRLNAVLLISLPIAIGVAYYLHPVFFRLNEPAGLFYLFAELIAACSFLIDILMN